MEGWIKLHRKLSEHWIWKDPVKLKWWLDILFTVNHDENKVNIGFDLFDCKRGQSIMSLQNWALRWGVNKDTVRNFFKLLEKDSMIIHENLLKTTRITVCKYDSYQTSLHDEQTQSKRKANAKQTQSDTNKNEKNVNNEKNEKNIPDFEEFKNYALIQKPNISIENLKLKYESWKVNDWKDGNDNEIINWKKKLLNTIPHIKETQPTPEPQKFVIPKPFQYAD